MGYNFYSVDRDQMYLMPPSLRDWLGEDDLAWVILDAVDQMNLEPFYRKYREDGSGHPAYDPAMMVALLLYSYSLGVRSSREIERLCRRDIGFRVITANRVPDHSTIARFRDEHREALGGLFVEVLKLLRAAGLVRVGVVALDGTKVKAHASLQANRSYRSIREEVERWLEEAAERDAEEDKRAKAEGEPEELPAELRDRRSRIRRLEAAKRRLEEEAEARAREQARKTEEYRERDDRRGRPPKAPEVRVDPEAQANVTDPDSRVMKTRQGYLQGYNGQVLVTEDQVVLAAELTQEANDVHQLHPMLEKGRKNLEAIGSREKIGVCLSDAGYWSEANLHQADPRGPELLIATQKDWKERKTLQESPPPRGRIPKHLSLKERMERKLRTRRGRMLYKKRSAMVEPVFGQMKEARGIDGFLLRGLERCSMEWKLIWATHNLLKLWRHLLHSGTRRLEGRTRPQAEPAVA